MSSSCGLYIGLLASILLMRCLAWGDKDDGMEYRASRMHRYVSLRLVVSMEVFPKAWVYLLGWKCSIINKHFHDIYMKSKRKVCPISLHHTTECPHVRFTSMPLLIEDFRRQVVWGPHIVLLRFSNGSSFAAKPKSPTLSSIDSLMKKLPGKSNRITFTSIWISFKVHVYQFNIPLELNPWFWHCRRHIWAAYLV